MTGIDLYSADSLAADHEGLLLAAASAGAQIRSLAEHIDALPEFGQPRALVVLGDRGELDLARSVLDATSSAPTIASTGLPRWIGPLDVVLAPSADPRDEQLAGQLALAVRRGATTVVRTAADGAPAQSGALVLPAVIGVPEALAGPSRLALIAAIATRCRLAPDPQLSDWAERADVIAVRCRPSADPALNPALLIADAIGTATPILVGADPAGDAIGRYAAGLLQDLAGVAASAIGSAAVAHSSALLRRQPSADDIFADPEPGSGHRWVIAGTGTSPVLAALERDLMQPVRLAPVDPVDPDSPPAAYAPVLTSMVLAGFVAGYLSLIHGQLPQWDAPDGLGRPGSGGRLHRLY